MRSEAEAEVTCTQGDTHTQRTSIASPGSLYAMWGRSYTHVHSIIFHAPPPPPLFLGRRHTHLGTETPKEDAAIWSPSAAVGPALVARTAVG